MTVELNNEVGDPDSEAGEPDREAAPACDEVRLVSLAEHVLRELRIHPQAELSVLLVDEDTMSAYHERWMGETGPTDVLSFPMDELRPPTDGEDPPEGMLGDVVLCPAVARRQAAGAAASAHAAGVGRAGEGQAEERPAGGNGIGEPGTGGPRAGGREAGWARARTTMQAELEYLLVHGILHLLGFDHATAAERTEMFGLTDALIAAWRPRS